MTRRRAKLTEKEQARVEAGRERAALRAAGQAYDITDAEGVRHVWNPTIAQETEERFARLRAVLPHLRG